MADVMSPATTSAPAPLFDMWGSSLESFGVELMIFGLTFLFANLTKGKSFNWQAEKQKTKAIQEVDKAVVDKPAQSNRAVRTNVNPATRPYQQRDGRPPILPRVHKTHPEPWQIINEVVEGMREHQAVKFSYRSLSLYGELKAELETQGLTLLVVARFARHSAVDFYTVLVQCAVRTNQHQLVMNFVDDMVQRGIDRPLEFYESAMKQLAGQKQYESALAVFDRLAADGLEPSAVTCSCLVGFAAEAGEFQRAVAFFAKLSVLSTPSIRAYMTILRVHAKHGDWCSAVALFRDMQHRNVRADSLVLNSVLAIGIAANQLEAVASLVEETENHVPPLPDIISYNTLMKGCTQKGDVDGAMRALDSMRRRGFSPNAISFNTAMDAAVRAGRCCDAWKVLEQMRAANLRPDKFSCSIMVKGIGQSADSQHIEAGLNLLRESGSACSSTLLSSMYNTILETASQAGDSSLLAKIFSQMSQQSVAQTASAQRLLVKMLPRSHPME